MPTPLRTSQTSGHSSFRVSNLPLWSLKSPPSHGSKIIIFYLSKSKCTVSALFLHGFKRCNGHSDLQNTAKGAEIAGRKITMLCAKIQRRTVRFLVGFSFFWMLAHLCTLFAHRRESRVFPCIVCILCIVAELVGAKPLHLAGARPLRRLKAPPGLSLLRCACKRELCSANCCFNVSLISCLAIKKTLLLNTLH